MASVVRFPYHKGDLKATGEAQHVADLPDGGGHTTRAVDFSKDGSKLFVAVGSASNVDDPDTTPGEKNRADILVCDPNNCQLKVYAYGIRNAGGGIRVSPDTGELWCSVNERDALGDNLVPDYITSVKEGGFYGWPCLAKYVRSDHENQSRPAREDRNPSFLLRALDNEGIRSRGRLA